LSEIRDLIVATTKSARANLQASSLAHLGWEALRTSPRSSSIAAAVEVEAEILRKPKVQMEAVSPNRFDIGYDHDSAVSSFDAFVTNQKVRGRFLDDVLSWLLTGSFADDGTLERFRSICKRHNVTGVQGASALGRPGDWCLVTSDWLRSATSTALQTAERKTDLADNALFLQQAVKSRSHFLLTGEPEIGKSLFVRHLLGRIVPHWEKAADPDLQQVRFVFLDQAEFAGSEAAVSERLQALYDLLAGHPQLIPVFDGFELFLNDSVGLGRQFTSFFGGILGGRRRTFVIVSRAGPASAAPLLRGVRAYKLPALQRTACLPILKEALAEALALAGMNLQVENGPERFCEELSEIAAERYPGRAFPEIGLRLIDAVVQRVLARLVREPGEPIITMTDVRRHVAREQGLSIEVLEKDPDVFYGDLAADLKCQEVIGQDHAVDRVCRVLRAKAKGKPRKLPRGRFLLVGPPGVGKTQLGRSLAKLLGYGTEGFFSYNMGDFATDGDRWRFVGSPVGYEGFGQIRTIFDEVRDRPSCVILLDEIDRAHTAIQDVLLAILEGEAKDAWNERVFFSQAIFLMTTNLGQDQVTKAYEQGQAAGLDRADIATRFNAILRDGGSAAADARGDARRTCSAATFWMAS
jgi:MoxR-like ATPase